MLQTDFSGDLPVHTVDDDLGISAGYSVEAVVGSAWNNLRSEDYKLPWETDFWDQFLDPNVFVMEQMSKGFKRPLAVPVLQATDSTDTTEVDRRVAAKPFPLIKSFLKHVKDVPERSWQEEREACWETGIRRWVALLDQWIAGDSTLLQAIQSKRTFSEKAQILVDVFYNKAPQTLIKRANSLGCVCGALQADGISFPCSEDEFYTCLKKQAGSGAPASRLKAIFEAVVFARHVLGLDELQTIISSRRCLGATATNVLRGPRQADPFTVVQLLQLHTVLREGDEVWDRAMAGMLLFCIYGRSRWADAQHAAAMVPDYDSGGELQSLELTTAVHKTARAFHLRHMFLPISAPAHGVSSDNWASQWLGVRELLHINDLRQFPLMPSPDRNLEPTRRPISTQEAKLWIHHLLGDEVSAGSKLTSHSCKCTCLSFLAKRGAPIEDRLTLGYHSNKVRMALTYSRDSAARPLALLSHVLWEIRTGVFEPDNTRSGRLKPGAGSLDNFGTGLVFPEEKSGADASGAEVVHDDASEASDKQSCQKVSLEPPSQVDTANEDEGHITTDSSDCSEGDKPAWGPVVGHYLITLPEDKKLWANRNSKMFHLSYEQHVKILLCGRRITESFQGHTGNVRFDAAKCRQCFRLKDS